MEIKYVTDLISAMALLLIPISILLVGKRIYIASMRTSDILKGIEARLKGIEDVASSIENELSLKNKSKNIK